MSLWEFFGSHLFAADIIWVSIWWLALCGVTAWLAQGKGQTPGHFFAIAFLFSPILGLLAVIAARDLRSASEAQMARDEFRELLGPLMLQIDGIRGHLAVSNETRAPSPQKAPSQPTAPAAPPRKASAAAPPEAAVPKADPALLGSASPS
jgi:hypothetical protein